MFVAELSPPGQLPTWSGFYHIYHINIYHKKHSPHSHCCSTAVIVRNGTLFNLQDLLLTQVRSGHTPHSSCLISKQNCNFDITI